MRIINEYIRIGMISTVSLCGVACAQREAVHLIGPIASRGVESVTVLGHAPAE